MIRVAIIDDHAVVRMGLKYALSRECDMVFVGEQAGGTNAAAFVARMKPDVTLLDIRMPDQDGISVLREIISSIPEAKVLMLTTSDADDDVYQSLKLGAKGYLMKDRDAASLMTAIRRIANGGKFVPEAVKALFQQRQMTPDLTEREKEVLELLADGLNNVEIAEKLGVSRDCIKIHVGHIFDKLEVTDRVEAAMTAVKRGFLKR